MQPETIKWYQLAGKRVLYQGRMERIAIVFPYADEVFFWSDLSTAIPISQIQLA